MKNILILFCCTLMAVACEGPQKATSTNQSFLYNKNIGRLHPKFNVYHTSDTESQLDFLLDATELQYMKHENDSVMRAFVTVSVILHAKFESTEILDSASTRLSDLSDGKNDKFIHGQIKFKASYPNTYYLQVTIKDLNRKSMYQQHLFVNKADRFDSQNFLLLSDEGREFFGSDISSSDRVQILCSNPSIKGYIVKYYKRKPYMPGPPFSLKYSAPTFSRKPDSTFVIPVPGGEGIGFKKQGIYLLQPDSSKGGGITIQRYYDGFPEVTNTELLVNALRFITSKEEYDKLHSAKDKKAAVDKYWLDLAGNEERARELISKYYNRIQDANRYFTSYTEGWRTDRGMIFLIFGPPETVYKNGTSESWIYQSHPGVAPLSFVFVHENNPISDNDYQLRREPQFKAPWYKAVEAWRQGKTYTQE